MKKKVSLYFQLFSFITLGSLVMTSCGRNNNIIQTEDKNIVSITVKESTIPDEIFIGHFDEAGIKLIVTYSDNTTEEVALTSSMIPENYQQYLNTPGEYTIKVYYRDNETTITIKIVDAHYTVKFYAYTLSNNYLLVDTQDILKGGNATAPFVNNDVYYNEKHYSFKNWNRSFTNVTANIDVYANYDVTNFYVVNFYNAKSELISTQKVDEGKNAVEPTSDERSMSGYEFVGWDRSYLNVTKSINVYGLYVSVEAYRPNGLPIEAGKITFYFTMADNELAKAIPDYCSIYLTGYFLNNSNWPVEAADVVTLTKLSANSNIYYGQWEGDYVSIRDNGYQLTLGYAVDSGAPSTGVNWSYKSIECQEAAGVSGIDNPKFVLSSDGKTADLGTHHWEEVPPKIVLAQNVTLSITLQNAAPSWVTLYAPGNYRNNWACNASDAMTPSADRRTWTINIQSAAVNTYEMKIIAEYTQDTRSDGNSWHWNNIILCAADGSGNFSLKILRSYTNNTINLNEVAEEGEIHTDCDFATNLPDPTIVSVANFRVILGAVLDTTVNPKWYIIGSFTGWKAVELSLNQAKTELTTTSTQMVWDSEASFAICADEGWHIAVKAYDENKDEYNNFSYFVPHVEHNVSVTVSAEEVVKMNTAIDPGAWVNVKGSLTVTNK